MAKTKSKKYEEGGPVMALPETKKKHGYEYTLVKRSPKAAIYKQVDPTIPEGVGDGYEVFEISISNPCTLVDKRTDRVYDYPAKEKFPGDGDFGKTAWAFNTLEFAQVCFKEINEGKKESD